MKAMILAAGKGTRMGLVSESIPKPLTLIGSKSLIELNIIKIKEAGIDEIIINVAWLGSQIIDKLGDGSKYGVKLNYSNEGDFPIGTAAGIYKAINFFDNENFLLINADIYIDYIMGHKKKIDEGKLGHLILVKNPEHHLKGDFSLKKNNIFLNKKNNSYTYSGMSILSPNIFYNYSNIVALEDVFKKMAINNELTGELYEGFWSDIGTSERLLAVKNNL